MTLFPNCKATRSVAMLPLPPSRRILVCCLSAELFHGVAYMHLISAEAYNPAEEAGVILHKQFYL